MQSINCSMKYLCIDCQRTDDCYITIHDSILELSSTHQKCVKSTCHLFFDDHIMKWIQLTHNIKWYHSLILDKGCVISTQRYVIPVYNSISTLKFENNFMGNSQQKKLIMVVIRGLLGLYYYLSNKRWVANNRRSGKIYKSNKLRVWN